MDAGRPRRRNNEAHHRGVADDETNAGAAQNTIQSRIWREIFYNPLALLLMGFNLFMVWVFISQVGLSRESLPGILMFLFFLMPIFVGMSLLPIFMDLDYQNEIRRASAAAMTPPASGSGTN